LTELQAGYSGTPLARKLGIGEDDEVLVIGAADGFADRLEAQLDGEAVIHTDINDAVFFDVIVVFVTWRAELEAELDRLRSHMAPACGLWVAWPKRPVVGGIAKVPTDMTDNVIRQIALPTGLVDNKVCAIDETWSGLRLVIRRELR
jgi:tetrahydromethanopterin S-methyltransferase subunit B